MNDGGQQFETRMPGVVCRPLVQYHDSRGWLAEIFRQDEMEPGQLPAMAYISVTQPGVGRGPHAHCRQTDLFCFPGPGEFRVVLWDQRPESPAFGTRWEVRVGASRPVVLIVPPGVVHGYLNSAHEPGVVFNCANRLYQGPGRRDEVDEIRFEDDPDSPFRLE
jgi:dTDP-4-dehydrorhamnose 3,5-epimerase